MKENQILQYDFTRVHSTIISDASNTGAAGVIRNYDAGGASIITTSIYGVSKNAIYLPGSELGGYIQLPDGILKTTTGFTVSTWCNISSATSMHTLFSFGKDTSLYVDILPTQNKNKVQIRPCVTSGGRSQEWTIKEEISIDYNRWYLLTLTLTDGDKPNQLSLYLDGKQVATLAQTRLSAAELENTTCNYIGMGHLSDIPCNLYIADFGIYNRVLEENEVALLFDISEEERLQADLQELVIPEKVTTSIILPDFGQYGSLLSWASSSQILSNDGSISRPSFTEGDQIVSLTVTATYGDKVREKRYYILVEALPSDEVLLSLALNELKLPSLHAIYQDITLPTTSSYGVEISYESDSVEFLGNTGTVNRPSMGEPVKYVILTVTAHTNGLSLQKKVTARVLPQYQKTSILNVLPIHIDTVKNVTPTLPMKAIVEYSNNTYGEEFISWNTLFNSFDTEGEVLIKGKVRDYDYLVTATITVLDSNITALGDTHPLDLVSLQGDHIFTDNYKRSMDYLLMLDADRMLYNFRMTYGINTKNAKPLGGWDEPTGLLRGHSTGHYISALSLAYSSSNNQEIKDKLDYMVSELYNLQKLSKGKPQDFKTICSPTNAAQQNWSADPSTWGEGFLSAYSPDQFALLEQFTPYATIWAPYYTLHKLLAGFLDCYHYTKNEKALSLAKGIGSWTYHRLNFISKETRDRMWTMYIAGEYGGMNESLARLYVLTNEPIYIEASKMFDNPRIFDGLSNGEDVIHGIHANQHIPQIIGALWEYKATSDPYYYNLAKSFFHIVTEHYMYSIGGVGRGENFKEADVLANNIELDRNCETCAAYNMLKLTKELYSYSPDTITYMDYYERTLINHIVPSQNPNVSEHMHHGVTYMLPIGPGEHREYSSDYHDFTCCHGTGMENHVKYQEAVYFIDKEHSTLTVNLYLPSTITWREKHIRITQTQSFPSETSTLVVTGTGQFTLRLRIPHWITKDSVLKINGDIYDATLTPSSYCDIQREWNDNDTISLYTPFSIYLDKTIDSIDGDMVASIMYGPFVMVAKNSKKDFMTLVLSPDIHSNFTVTASTMTNIRIQYDTLEFVPMYRAYDCDYHTYFKVIIPY